MAPPSACPSAAVLHAIAAGGIEEPVLGVYLEHLEQCDDCCRKLGAETPSPVAFWSGDWHAGPRETGPALDEAVEGERLSSWLEQLKREIPAETAAAGPVIGQTIGPFRIVGMLGEGASAVVYEAVDEELGRLVVLKVLRAIHGEHPERRAMVIEEARALAAMQHEAIMPLLQLVWLEDVPVLVFPRLPGRTLAATLADDSVTWQEAVRIVRDVARGLGHAHGLGVCHHDVKPTNIWLHRPQNDGPSRALLFDFGLTGGAADSAGTPGYREPAPQATDRPESRDLFSLGVVLHECLERCPDAPARCRDLIRRLTTERAADRPGPSEVVATIDRLLEPSFRRPLKWTTAAGLAACCAVVAVAVASMVRGLPTETAGGPLRPATIIEPRGLPVGIAASAAVWAFVDADSTLHVREVSGDRSLAKVSLAFQPEWLSFTREGTRLAAANTAGDLAIVDVPTQRIVHAHRFPNGISWLGWSGWERDAVAILSDGQVSAVCGRRRKNLPVFENVPDEWTHVPLRDGVVRMAVFPNSEAVLSVDADGNLTAWSFGGMTEDTPLGPPRFLSRDLADVIFGWKIAGMAFVVRDDRVFEIASLHGPEAKSQRIVAAARAIVWPTATEYVELGRTAAAGRSRLVWGDVQKPGSHRELDAGADAIERIELSDDHRQVVAITTQGGIRIYPLAR